MPISQSDQVFSLVKSLSKSEKRNFRLYAGRIQDRDSLRYLKLFDLFDKQAVLDERATIKKLGSVSKTQYSNLKRHLYSQILISLRHLQKEKKAYIKIREYIDFAYILYDKGLYMPALKILAKAKKLAIKNHTDFSLLTIVEVEKMIQSRHITRTNTESIETLVKRASNIGLTISNRVKISNLKVLLHRYYIRYGHVTNADEEKEITEFFEENRPRVEISELGMMEKIHLYQSYVWYYYILNQFEDCYKYSLLWVELFESSEELLNRDMGLYLRGYHYLLTSAYNNRDVKKFVEHLDYLDKFRDEQYHTFNENNKIASFVYVHFGRMNRHFLEGSFDIGIDTIKRTLNRIKRYRNYLDEHKIAVLNYKISWMYLGNEMYKKANNYLLEIINDNSTSLRNDIQIYARLMHLILHIDSENYTSIPYLVKSYDKFISNTKDINEVQIQALEMFKEISKAPILERKGIYKHYQKILQDLEHQKYARRAFLYLDLNSWMESKVTGIRLSEILRRRYNFEEYLRM
jgi:hypothetical protein